MAPTKRILVTGAGGAPGFDLARHLMRLGCDVIAADANPLACGLTLQGVAPRILPPGGHPDFGMLLLELCRNEQPDALISTVEHELPALVREQDILAELGVRTWLPSPDAVAAAGDKAVFHAVLSAQEIPTPITFLPPDIDEAPEYGPLVVKPRQGQGAQGVHFCETRAQAKVLCELVPDPIVQARVRGQEFTADCLVDRTGRASVILRHRLLVKAGLSVVSRTFHDDEVAEQVKRTLAAVGMVGPCCVQGFICDGGDRVIVTETNARLAGAFPLAEAAGAALVQQTLNGLFELPVDHAQLAYTANVYLTKCFETVSVGPWPPAHTTGGHGDGGSGEDER
ncbi:MULTISPECIES: ATP-grasp domain-containing protein [unclassified Streptomyces]|uniref:ATP-grasp domain-containing protein n=1 Tax=unclassified Streptomyces TaxID=2593676 RepID=UPI0021C87534|nr:ATP-grasp domain-containing protein [Streptomyces sp. FIT100]UUN29943.1 ATP-grasp domain-containing protein [Streptomyces sp. FIT100]